MLIINNFNNKSSLNYLNITNTVFESNNVAKEGGTLYLN